MKQFLVKNRIYLLNILFILFLIFFQKPLVQIGQSIIFDKNQNYLMGIILIIVIILESIGAYRKVPAINQKYTIQNKGGIIFGLIFHSLVGVMMIMTAIQALHGGDINEALTTRGFLLFLEVMRHLFLPISISLKIDTMNQNQTKISASKEFGGDIFLLLRTCMSYTLTRGTIITRPGMGLGGNNIGISILYTIAAAILFLMFYGGANLVFLLEQYEQLEEKQKTRRFVINLCVITVIALYPLYSMPAQS